MLAPSSMLIPSTSTGVCSASWSRCTADCGGAAVRAGHEHGEFVAAEACDEILGTEGGPQPRPDRLEHEVAAVMPERVVDLLEAVEVDEQEPTALQRRVLERAAPTASMNQRRFGSSVRLSWRARCSAVAVRTVWRPLMYTPTSGTSSSG